MRRATPCRRHLLPRLTALLLGLVIAAAAGPGARAWAAAPLQGRVGWIYDGDTIEVDQVGKVRLLGIDAPEHEDSARDRFYRRWGIAPAQLRQVARDGVRYLVSHVKGKVVTLRFDRSRRDSYGRLLAYVFLPDQSLLNLTLVAKGYASVFRKYPFSRKAAFLAAERQARSEGLGLWAASRP